MKRRDKRTKGDALGKGYQFSKYVVEEWDNCVVGDEEGPKAWQEAIAALKKQPKL
jgi:hypothetical protein